MVASNEGGNGSLHAPLLGDYTGENHHSVSNGTQENDVVVTVPDESREDLERTPSRQNIERHSVAVKDGQSGLNSDEAGLAFQSRNTFQQIHDAHGPHSKGDLESSSLPRCVSRRRRNPIRNPIRNKSFVARAAHSARNDTRNFLYNVMIGLYMWPKWSWEAMKANSSLTILSAKQGVVAGLASILCVVRFPQPFTEISSIALWAVVTTDLLYEGNIGLSVSKGFNRVLGTLAAGCIAVVLNQVGPLMGDALYPYFVVICVMLGGGIFRFLKGIPPLKDQWGYAFTVATIAFHLFVITAYTQPERWTLPMLRFSMILLGFAMSTVFNIAIKPIYAGDALHKLVAKNFETAAYVFQRCVEEYNKDTKLDHVPDILSGRSVDDKIHQSYHEIVMSDSDIDKLLSAVHWEPSHGNFFMGYPWHLYDDITDYLRYTLYDVIALDSCLRANIQAPKHLRDIFAKEMATIASECAVVLRTLGDSMKNMKKFASEDIMRRAEEAAVVLQYKIHLHTDMLLGNGEFDSPMYPAHMATHSSFESRTQKPDIFSGQSYLPRSLSEGFQDLTVENGKPSISGNEDATGDLIVENGKPSISGNEDATGDMNAVGTIAAPGGNGDIPMDLEQKEIMTMPRISSPGTPSAVDSRKSLMTSRSGKLRTKQNALETLTEGLPVVSVPIPNGGLPRSVSTVESSLLAQDVRSSPGRVGTPNKRGWKEIFLHRKSSLGHNWDGTLERISALSFVKFASLLIEVVSKMQYVVDCVEDLSQQARFKECDPA